MEMDKRAGIDGPTTRGDKRDRGRLNRIDRCGWRQELLPIQSHVEHYMPFLSYQVDEVEAIRNAGRFLVEGQADCVKLEVDGTFTGLVSQLNRAGIPVIAHIGSRPQQVKHDGGYRAAGRTRAEASRLVEEARRLEEAGATMLLIEAVPCEVTEEIVSRTSIPVIGCGAGPACPVTSGP